MAEKFDIAWELRRDSASVAEHRHKVARLFWYYRKKIDGVLSDEKKFREYFDPLLKTELLKLSDPFFNPPDYSSAIANYNVKMCEAKRFRRKLAMRFLVFKMHSDCTVIRVKNEILKEKMGESVFRTVVFT